MDHRTAAPALDRWQLRSLLSGFFGILVWVILSSGVCAAPDEIWILASGDLRGEIKPCGCSPEGQMGGLPRRLTYLDQRQREYGDRLVTVDLGNNFPDPSPQGVLKVDLIQSVLKHARLDAVLPGPNELSLGVAALDQSLPYVLSNSLDPAPLGSIRTIERAGRRVGIFGYLAPDEVYQGLPSALRLERVNAPLLSRWRTLIRKNRVQAVVLLFRGSNADLALFVQSGLFDAIVTGNPSADESKQITQRIIGNTLVPQVPTKGQGVLRWPLLGARVGVSVTIDWLNDSYTDHALAVKAMADYDERVKALFLQQAAAAEAHWQESPFAGAQACKTCHAPVYAVWQRSSHANALSTLQHVGKAFDPECLTCHVVWLGKHGYISQDVTPSFANVQCENCHGPSKAHAAQPAVKPVPPAGADSKGRPTGATCSTCHHGRHSPRFTFEAYWPKIRH